jgi:hypothetical protein
MWTYAKLYSGEFLICDPRKVSEECYTNNAVEGSLIKRRTRSKYTNVVHIAVKCLYDTKQFDSATRQRPTNPHPLGLNRQPWRGFAPCQVG